MAAKITEINNACPIIDSQAIEREIVRLEKDAKALRELRNKFSKGFPEQAEGVALIRDDFFLEYAKSVAANDLASLNLNVWPLQFINWKEAIKAFKIQHTPIDFAGVTYWVRKK